MAAYHGRSRQRLHFFSWMDNPEYQTPVGEPLGELGLDEKRLVRDLGASHAQLRWRRRKMSGIGFIDQPEKFKREYPSDVKEAFAVGGDRWFDQELVDELELSVEALMVEVVEETLAGWRIYEEPSLQKGYVIGADIASGESEAASGAVILNVSDFTQAAEFRSKTISTDLFALTLAEMGARFNHALVAPESNNMGHAVVSDLLHVHLYPHLFEYERYNQVVRPERGANPWVTREWGWPTNVKTRQEVFNAVSKELRQRLWLIRSLELVDEIRKTIRKEGQPRPGLGSTGDLVIALGIALEVVRRTPNLVGAPLGGLNTGGGPRMGVVQAASRVGDRLGGAAGATLLGIMKEEF